MNVCIDGSDLQRWMRELLEKMGVSETVASSTAESLVDAELRGISTHGLVRFPLYVKRLRLGLINKNPKAAFVSSGAAAETMDGDNGLGQWVGLESMMRACDLAASAGIGMVLAKHSNHFGAAGWFARKANQRGFAAIVWTQAESHVVPFGGTERLCGTNPICISMPWTEHEPITLDMATSAIPYGKVELAKAANSKIPPDWAVDGDGAPTTDPHRVHALQPMAGPKGSGLGLLIDLLSGGLAGETCGPAVTRMYEDFEHPHNLAHGFIAIKAASFSAAGRTDAVIDKLAGKLRGQRPASGFSEVLLPGELEVRNAKNRLQKGIDIPQSLFNTVQELSNEYGVPDFIPADANKKCRRRSP